MVDAHGLHGEPGARMSFVALLAPALATFGAEGAVIPVGLGPGEVHSLLCAGAAARIGQEPQALNAKYDLTKAAFE